MKRHFMKSLMALCAGVMTLVAASSLFVSCYDDSALREDINGLDKRLQTVEQLKTQLAELTARVDGLYTLSFQVTTDNKLQYSFDGKTWTTTDIVLTGGECDCVPSTPCQCVPCDHKCPEVSLVDNGETVTIKVGDAEFTIVKPEEIMFEIRAGKLYFMSEDTQQVVIKSSGIEDVTVMSAPKGWWAEITSDGLVEITAPDYTTTQDDGYWDENYENYTEVPAVNAPSGYVKIHACASDGKCMVGRLPVEVVFQALSVKAYTGKAYYNVAGAEGWANSFYYGVSSRESLEADTAPLFAALPNHEYSVLDEYANSFGEASVICDIAELLGAEPELGKEYVVWALREDSDKSTFSLEDLVIAYYSPVQVKITEVEAERTAYNVTINVEVSGADRYVAYASEAAYLEDGEDAAKEMMLDAIKEGEYLGKVHYDNYLGSAFDITKDTKFSGMNYAPMSGLYVVVLPLDGRPNEDYTADDVYVAEFTTAGLQPGGTVNMSAERITEFEGLDPNTYEMGIVKLDPFTQLGLAVELPETGWKAFYYEFMTEEDYNLCGLDELLVEKLLGGYGYAPEDLGEMMNWPNMVMSGCATNSTYYFVGFLADADGKYGELAKVELTTDELAKAEISWDGAYTSNVTDGLLKNTTVFEFTPQLTEDVASYKYIWKSTNDYHPYENMDDAAMAEKIYFAKDYESTTVAVSELVDGKIVIEDNEYNSSYYFAVIPLTSEGTPGYSAAIVEYDCSFVLDAVITDFPAAEPTITFTIPEKKDGDWTEPYYWFSSTRWGDEYTYQVSCHVEPVEGTVVKVHIVEPVEALDYGFDMAAMTDLEKASALWSNTIGYNTYNIAEFTEAGDTPLHYFCNAGDLLEPVILACWTFEGKYYYKEYSLAKEFKTMLYDLKGEEEPLPSPDGKQWLFYWDGYGTNAVLDFGVTMPGQLAVAYDPAVMGAPEGTPFMIFNAIGYEFVPVDETSGRIVISSQNMFGEISSEEYTYTDFTGTSCYFNFGEESFLAQDVDGELTEVTVDASGGIM